MILENDGAPRTMQPDDTFPSAETFVSEMLTFNDNRFLSQPNAAFTENDCREQMAVKTLLRDISHRYINREYSHGLFLLQLTDLHANNIFIDDEWNVTCLIDLEWICSLPAPMLRVPYWLTGLSIDELEDEKYVEFDSVRKEFLSELEQVEMQNEADHGVPISQLMEDTWQSKSLWFWYCISSVNAMYFLLEQHLCSLPLDAEKLLSEFWCQDSREVVRRKLADKKAYDCQLERLFSKMTSDEFD